MPRIASDLMPVPTLVLERMRAWGAAIRHQRVAQGLRAVDLCARMGISHPTLMRAERGEPSVSANVYLTALHILGLLDNAAPAFDSEATYQKPPAASPFISLHPARHVTLRRARPAKCDDEYF